MIQSIGIEQLPYVIEISASGLTSQQSGDAGPKWKLSKGFLSIRNQWLDEIFTTKVEVGSSTSCLWKAKLEVSLGVLTSSGEFEVEICF
jgi:hypothetical protein